MHYLNKKNPKFPYEATLFHIDRLTKYDLEDACDNYFYSSLAADIRFKMLEDSHQFMAVSDQSAQTATRRRLTQKYHYIRWASKDGRNCFGHYDADESVLRAWFMESEFYLLVLEPISLYSNEEIAEMEKFVLEILENPKKMKDYPLIDLRWKITVFLDYACEKSYGFCDRYHIAKRLWELVSKLRDLQELHDLSYLGSRLPL